MEEITLKIINKIEYLHLATTLSREVCKTINTSEIDDEFSNTVELVVSEAITNVIKHSNASDSKGNISISFQICQDRLVVNVKDQGQGFDFNRVPEPDLEKHPEGGYGVFIIKSRMDKVGYERGVDWNTLSMTKYFGRAETKD